MTPPILHKHLIYLIPEPKIRRRWGGEKQGERKERGRGWRKRRGMLIIEPNIMDPPHVQRKNRSVLDNTFISSSNKLVTYNQILFDWGLLHLGSGGYYLKIVSFMNSIIFLLYFYFFHDKVVGKKKHHFRMSNIWENHPLQPVMEVRSASYQPEQLNQKWPAANTGPPSLLCEEQGTSPGTLLKPHDRQ